MSKDLVLVSGLNGYIGANVVKHFLDNGHRVRGTVRKASSAQQLIEGPLKEYYQSGDLQVAEVPDITADGAFDEAVKGVNAIAHIASPVSFFFTDPGPILHAAIQGTKTILESAHAHAGSQLRSVVVTSSVVAVMNQHPKPYTLTEKDWNDWAEQMCKEMGKDTPGRVIYAASKVAAERAFWAFQKERQPSFSMSSINPVFVIGPPVIAPRNESAVSETIQHIWQVFSGGPVVEGGPGLGNVVDVRDVAQLLEYMTQHPKETNGQRYLASSAISSTQNVSDILRENAQGDSGTLKRIVPGTRGEGYSKDYKSVDTYEGPTVDSSKAKALLKGQEWISFQKSVVDTAKTFEGLV